MENAGLIQEMRIETSRDLEDVETELSSIEGVRSVECDTDSKTVTVQFDPTVVDDNVIRQVADSGAGEAGLGNLASGEEPVSGLNVAYGGVNRSPASQGRPPSTTI